MASSAASGAVAPTITTSHEGPVSSDAALAQLAAEAGLLEGEGSLIQVNLQPTFFYLFTQSLERWCIKVHSLLELKINHNHIKMTLPHDKFLIEYKYYCLELLT